MNVAGRRTAVVGVLALVAALLAAAPASASKGVPASKASPASPGFIAVAPTRLLDTRTDPAVHALGPGQSISVQVTGLAHVPATGVETVVLNLTGITAARSAYLTVYPTGGSRPLASNLNLVQSRARANQVFARVGADGSVEVFNSSGSTDVIVDVSGYFATGSSYTGQSPVRVLDTRSGGGGGLAAGVTRTVHLAGAGNIPSSGVSAVVANITGISLRGSTYVTAYPAASTRPTTSNLNLAAGQTAAVLAVVELDANGDVALFNSGGPTHLVLDITGWFSGSGDYTPVPPSRLLDSRVSGSVNYGNDTALQVGGASAVPATAGAAVLSVTVIDPQVSGYVSVWPDGSPISGTSSVNAERDRVTSNLVVAQLSAGGRVAIFDHAFAAYVVVDVVGWIDTNQALSITPPLPGPAEVREPYSLAMTSQAGLAPLTWSVTGGPLPSGLTLDPSSGQISGTPTVSGIATPNIQVTDSSGAVRSQAITVAVYPFVSSTLWAWGRNNGGWDLPTTSVFNPTPFQMGQSAPVARVTPGNYTVYVVHSDGTLWAWGERHLVGNNLSSDTPATTPVQVNGLSGITQVATGATDTYALTSSGTVWAWGSGAGGNLGNGSQTDSYVPVQVSGLSGVTEIGAGSHAAYALKADGTLWAWGGQLPNVIGNGGAATSAVPLQVDGLPAISSLGIGGDGYALATDGTVWGWGQAQYGQLGTATSVASRAPVQIAGLTHISSVRGGGTTGYALTDAGTVLAWGRNIFGQLGNGTLTDNAIPTQVPGVTDVTQIGASGVNGYALTGDGSLWAWGSYMYSMRGDGHGYPFPADSTLPSRVLLPPVSAVAASVNSLSAFAVGRP